jgi:LPXTG-site transpeptidase (sortase) family protein
VANSAARLTQILFEQIEDFKESHDPETNVLLNGQTEGDLPFEQTESYSHNSVSENAPLLIEINGEKYIGILSIPELSLELPINDEWSEKKLKETPCRYAGEINTSLVIAGHNYKNHFGSLAKLVKGDTVTLTDAAGVNHSYIVEKIETINATDIDVMLDDSYGLTLFTCNYSGMARIAVRAVKRNP